MSVHEAKTIDLLNHVDIRYFDEDPEDDPDRAGDGYYFHIDGEDGWSGAWDTEDDAEQMAREQLEDWESRRISDEFHALGYLKVKDYEDLVSFVNKIDDRWFVVDVAEDNVRIREAFKGGGRTVADLSFEKDPDVYGDLHQTVLQALEALSADLQSAPVSLTR